MDALTRRQFDRAMFAKDRTLAIRVGDYATRDIKEASFEYGYIKGDTYKPGGTCAGSGKITFTSIITTFNKLDILHPEIGLLVGNTYQWVKMGEYFINEIEIDRNRNTTTLELMDGMFKLNREYVTDLHFPAEVREVIQEICLKTGIELANDYFGISAMLYHVEQVPEGKKLSFRDMLSAMTQMIGMSCFFNREGKMEIRDLTESNITINADSYFLHGLTKSEIEYQIAGITCKADKKSLTVGMRTGRSLEIDNVFMTQPALNNLYHKLKDITYYPYNLNYQGHLLLEVGQWVTIQTNKNETFKVPVLSQSFAFKGGLRGRISADSKAGNDTQYSYEGTITKQIKQQDSFEAKIQAQIEAADAAFEAEFEKRKKAIDDAIEIAKAKAEEVKRELSDTINQRFDNFDNASIQEAKRRAEEALRNAGASSLLAQEAKNISERARTDITNLQASSQNALSQIEAFKTEYGTKLNEFKSTSDGILTKLGAIETYVNKDGQRQESLQRYARDESARQVSAVREQISRDYVGKSTYQENVRGLERRFSAISTQTNNDISTKIAQYKQTVDGQFASITSQIAGKANQTDFQRVRETSQLYERIIGSNENDISNKVARMAMTNKLFQVEVAKNEGLKTVQRQIAGSWAVQNINSAGDLISGINLGANGHNRFDGKLTHITGETLIDKAVIKSAMIDKLKTANFEAGSVTTVVLDAEAVTAEKLKVDQAFFNKFVANEAYLNLLFAKQAFINRVRSISIDASQITTGTLSGDRINGETITGVTLKGNTRIKIGDHGSLDAINGGLQINVPRELNSKDGLGVQFIGSYGRGEDVPYGLFVYKDSDFTTSGYAVDTDDFILTVRGYIKAKGIGWLRTNEGSVGGGTTATIGFWKSSNVSLDFGGSGNDIYYSYNGTAYSLWEIVNNHFSDKRLKENIVACEHQALDYINQFSFKEYDWKKQGDRPQKSHTKIGLIAQEVQEVDDTLVYKNGDTLNLDNLRLTTIALKAIQELDLENRKLTQRLENLENERRTA